MVSKWKFPPQFFMSFHLVLMGYAHQRRNASRDSDATAIFFSNYWPTEIWHLWLPSHECNSLSGNLFVFGGKVFFFFSPTMRY